MTTTYTEATAWAVTCVSGAASGAILGAERVPGTGAIVAVSLIAGTAFVVCARLVRASRRR